MSVTQLPCSRPKRQHAEQFSERSIISQLEPDTKRQKRDPTGRAGTRRPAPEFWDNLSTIWLTKGTLTELDRRNSVYDKYTPCREHRRSKRRLTRQFYSKLQSRHLVQYAPDFLSSCGPDLFKEIKELSKHGGPDLSDLRNFPQYRSPLNRRIDSSQPSLNKRRPSTTAPSSNKRSSRSGGTYSRNFEQHLIDHGIYPEGYRYPSGQKPRKPKNWTVINQQLDRPRDSLSPSRFTEEEFEKFKEANTDATVELLTNSVIPTIEGGITDRKAVGGGYPFGNLKPLTDGTISSAWPDRFFGARPEQLDRQIRCNLHDTIVPSTQDSRPILPNFYLEVKSSDQSAAVAKRQACYDAALGARAMQNIQSYGNSELAYDSNAYTIASTYHDGTLKLYTSHPIKTVGARHEPEYIMTQLNSWSMTGNLGTFQQGATWYRNARDWAKERRDEFVETANAMLLKEEFQQISSSQKVSVSVSTVVSIDSDSSSESDPTEFQDAQWSFAAPIEDVGEEAQILSKN
ncbi:hypothetical protein BDFG_07884 [Blastomyces dermatitidis ATCC 26199]|nr:hypothetical protein BDFG_07884 [Blastomyces dermatitidis ATCC 26199]